MAKDDDLYTWIVVLTFAGASLIGGLIIGNQILQFAASLN